MPETNPKNQTNQQTPQRYKVAKTKMADNNKNTAAKQDKGVSTNTPAVLNQNETVDEATGEVTTNNGMQLHTEENVEIPGIVVDVQLYQNTVAMLDDIDNMNNGVELTAEYVTMETPGEELRGMYMGLHQITSTQPNNAGQLVDAVKLMVKKDGAPKFIIMADIKLVGTLRGYRTGVPVKIKFLGMEKGKNGKYRDFSIQQIF